MSATAQVVDNKMVPMGSAGDKPQMTVTGQWFFDNFVGTEGTAEQISRMNMVRLLVTQASQDDLKTALADMIKIAHKYDVAAGVPEKERGPKRAQAMNARTVMQNSYGALKLALPELEKLGYNSKTGYHDMRVLSQQALKAHGVKWNGTPLPTDETKAIAEQAKERAAKREAFNTASLDNPQLDDEDDIAYAVRISKIAHGMVAKIRHEAQVRVASKLSAGIIQKQGRDIAALIVDRLQAFLTETSDMTDDEANARMADFVATEEQAEQEAREQQAA